MFNLAEMKNVSRPTKKIQRLGRGIGCKRGRTCGRGQKGDGSRSGYKRRYGYEGGQVPLYRKLPVRGFTRGRFAQPSFAINLAKIEAHYEQGETVNRETLLEKGLIARWMTGPIKILSDGILKKRVTIEASAYSAAAQEKLRSAGISFLVV